GLLQPDALADPGHGQELELDLALVRLVLNFDLDQLEITSLRSPIVPHCKDHARPIRPSFTWSVSWSNGFITYSSAPEAIPSRTWATSCSVVQKTTLGRSPPSISRNATMNSIPLITGMFQSRRIRAG